MKWIELALRNLFRNVRRTVLTGMAIAFGLTMMLLMVNLQNGQYQEMISKAISQMAGHVVIQGAGYQQEQDSEIVVERAGEVTQALSAEFPDAIVAPRITLGGLLNSTTNSIGIGLVGVEPEAEAAIGEFDDRIAQGSYLDSDRGILIGEGLAKALGVEIGDKVVYMGQHGDATEMTSRLFRVAGIFRFGSADIDGFLAVVHLTAAQELLGHGDAANRITLHLPDAAESERASSHVIAMLSRDDLDIRSWKQALPELQAIISADRTSGDVMLGILGLIVAMGVLNTVLMSVLERTREFGVMLALGMRPRQIASVVLLEGALLGFIGAALGLAGGLALSYPLVVYGIDYSSYLGGETFESGGIVISSVMTGAYDPDRMAFYVFGAVIMTALAAVYPAVHVSRLQPVDAMNHV